MKKVISMILAVLLIQSMCVCAADYIEVTNGTEAQIYSSVKDIISIDITSEIQARHTAEGNVSGGIYNGDTRVVLDASEKEFSNTSASNVSLDSGAVENVISSSESAFEGDTNSWSVKLETTEAGKASECQFNNLPIYSAGGITVVQNDFCLDEIPAEVTTTVSRLHYSEADASSYSRAYQSAVTVLAGGELAVTGNQSTGIFVEADKWYTVTQIVFQDKNRVDYYLDGTKIYSHTTSNPYTWLWKYSATNSKGEAKVTYLDNFKVFKATDKLVSLTRSNPAAGTVTEGTPVTLTAAIHNDEFVKSVKIYSSKNGKDYAEYSSLSSAVAFYSADSSYYKAVGFDADGNEVASSEPMLLTTGYVKNAAYWDVDFDEISMLSGAGPQYYLSADGANRYLNAEGKDFRIHAGAAGGAVAIRVPEADEILNTNSSKMLVIDNTAGTSNEAQINQLSLGMGGIVIVEFDFAVNALPASKSVIVARDDMKSATITATNFDAATQLELTTAGKLQPAGSTANVTVTPKTWYHIRQVINMENAKVDYYVNNTYLATSTLKHEDYTHISRFSATNNKNANILYYDNFNIYTVEKRSSNVEIESVSYYIDGVSADKMADGKLTAYVTLMSDGSVKSDLRCYAAVYDNAGKLKRVSVLPTSFADGEYGKLVELNLGNVSADDTAKIFFWSDYLLPNGAENEIASN